MLGKSSEERQLNPIDINVEQQKQLDLRGNDNDVAPWVLC
jgi:hypothetical protein